jgi:hypothetical protein
VLNGSESWTLSKAQEAPLGGFERKILMTHCGAQQIDGVCRTRYNKELYNLFNDVDIIKIINVKKLRWAGHVIRRENEDVIKRIMLVKPERKGKEHRTRIRWMDGVDKYLRNLGVVNWKTKAQERDGWRNF